jgi:hypothetical protein
MASDATPIPQLEVNGLTTTPVSRLAPMEDNFLEEREIHRASIKVNRLVSLAILDVGILGCHPSVVGLETPNSRCDFTGLGPFIFYLGGGDHR